MKVSQITRQVTMAILSFSLLSLPPSLYSKLTASDLEREIPAWMESQISKDLSLIDQPISLKEMNEYFEQNSKDLLLVKFSITNNKVFEDFRFPASEGNLFRKSHFLNALKLLCKTKAMPDMVFLLSLHDGFGGVHSIPVFGMSKGAAPSNCILLPDYEVLRGAYQVYTNRDVVEYEAPWNKKKPSLIWRGSTAQRSTDGVSYLIDSSNLHSFTRITLCELSAKFPELINAKFTFFAQGGENIPYLQNYKGGWESFMRQFNYKYHILIDGNVCAYSNSCWKLFTNSLIFKPDSDWVQWYYDALTPLVHYIPVRKDLADLVDKLKWAKENDSEAKLIAGNARKFAVENLTTTKSHAYLYELLTAYSKMDFRSE